MKQNLHPKVNTVVFKDISCDFSFLGTSTLHSSEKVKWEDGNEYPVVKLEISHTSHPFFTGKVTLVDTAGRIDKYNSRFSKFKK
jgi:large subunit ribosomal protein L31